MKTLPFFKRTLKSGARLVGEIRENDRGGTVYFKYAYGGLNTTGPNLGGAHVLEHMAFKERESENRKLAYKDFINIGGLSNAGTTFTETDFHVRVPLRNLDVAFNYLGLLLKKPEPNARELKKELEVINIEMARNHDHPEEYVHELTLHSIFSDIPPSSIFGTKRTINNFTPSDIQRFWREGYAPSRLVMGYVGGPVSIDELSLNLDKLLDVQKNNSLANPSILPFSGRPKVIKEKRKGLDQTYLAVAVPHSGNNSKNYPAFELLTDFLTELEQSRLYELIRGNSELAYRINGTLDEKLYYIDLGTHPREVDRVIKLIRKGFSQASKMGNSEFKLLKERSIGAFEGREYDSIELSDKLACLELGGKGMDSHYNYADMVNRITLPEFRRAAEVPYFGQVILSSD